MVIRKKISKPIANKEEIISRGGHVPADINSRKTKMTYLLTMPTAVNDEIVKKISKRIGISKNTWILEAIHEKLLKEKQ